MQDWVDNLQITQVTFTRGIAIHDNGLGVGCISILGITRSNLEAILPHDQVMNMT